MFLLRLQISNISSRIAALKSAGLNVDPQTRLTKTTRSTADPVLHTALTSEQNVEFQTTNTNMNFLLFTGCNPGLLKTSEEETTCSTCERWDHVWESSYSTNCIMFYSAGSVGKTNCCVLRIVDEWHKRACLWCHWLDKVQIRTIFHL